MFSRLSVPREKEARVCLIQMAWINNTNKNLPKWLSTDFKLSPTMVKVLQGIWQACITFALQELLHCLQKKEFLYTHVQCKHITMYYIVTMFCIRTRSLPKLTLFDKWQSIMNIISVLNCYRKQPFTDYWSDFWMLKIKCKIILIQNKCHL